MPWDASGADKHKKGMSEEQKKVWARIANAALHYYMGKGYSQKEAEVIAIKTANSEVG